MAAQIDFNDEPPVLIRALIADDEPLARKKLQLLLRPEPDICIVAECATGHETTAALKTYALDLLFLDIEMPSGNGLDVLRSIPVERMPIVIFTTAYDKYAVRAFEMHALDYLLKPFDRDRLRDAVQRARLELSRLKNGEFVKRLVALLASDDKAKSTTKHRLVVRSSGRVVFLDAGNVDWIEAAANYVRFHVGRESYLMRENISTVAGKLEPSDFVRIHRSTIVNVSRIKELQPCNSGEYIVVLRDGKELSCSRGYRAAMQQLIEDTVC
jgi:two-component system LytT family response regulator